MKKLSKNDVRNILIIALILLIYVLWITHFFEYLYGSTVDWDCQHWAIPDYFRKLFYETGNFLPNFAFNIGNGQNIFNFSYYGLLSPIILISYLFPFIKMYDYIQIASILGVFVSSILLYKWILDKYNTKTAMLSTITFITMVPILFHSHRHIMFTSYMPFLILCFIGVDKYFNENKKVLLISSLFLMIMTSYFFSVSGIFVVILYAISKFVEKNQTINIKKFLQEGIKFLSFVFLGIVMAAIIILPTLYVILEGRTESNVTIHLSELLVPDFSINQLFYGAYSPGLTALVLISLIFNLTTKKKNNIVLILLLIITMIFPVFAYILNGTMYIDYKVFIPFIPVLTLLVAEMLYCYENKKIKLKKVLIFSIVVGIALFIFNKKSSIAYLYLIDLSLILLLLSIGFKTKKNKIGTILMVLASSALSLFSSLHTDSLYTVEQLKSLEEKDSKTFDEIFSKEENIYRIANQNHLLQNINRIPTMNYYVGSTYSSTSNNNYKNFYYNESGNEITQRSYGKITSSMNIFYNLYNANKYLIPNDYIPVGYKKVDNEDNLYINQDVLPIIYATKNIMNVSEYEKLEFPYNMEAILNYVITDKRSTNNYVSKIEEYNGNIKIKNNDANVKIEEKENSYIINATKTSTVDLSVDNLEKDDILLIKFHLKNDQSCSKGDLEITINGIKNVLTCKTWKYHNKNTEFHYTISANEALTNLEITFSKGLFEISNLEIYKINYNNLKNIKNNVDEFQFNKEKTKDNRIIGNIEVSNDGYILMSIPYDKGFTIYLNQKEVEYEMVNNGFIGIPVQKGFYEVEILYNSPMLKEAKIISVLGITIYAFVIIIEKNRKRKIKSIAKK